MRFSEETLMAYADGELDLVTRAEIEAAMAQDPEVARAVERHRLMAAQVRTAYDGVLEEPVPERLASAGDECRDGRRSSTSPRDVKAAAFRSGRCGCRPGLRLPRRSPSACSSACS